MKLKRFNESTSDEIALELNDDMLYALKRYGEYSFEDKGPDEVMDMSKYDGIMKDKSIEEIAEILNKFYDLTEDKEHAVDVVNSIVTNLDDREDFEDLWNYDEHEIFEY